MIQEFFRIHGMNTFYTNAVSRIIVIIVSFQSFYGHECSKW